jgi:hypothetical protein
MQQPAAYIDRQERILTAPLLLGAVQRECLAKNEKMSAWCDEITLP